MNLPNAHLAVIERQKIVEYLLNADHPQNGGKARFFTSLGFTSAHWRALRRALAELATSAEATRLVESEHGRKYIVDGELRAPSGNTAQVRSVWIIDVGQLVPRLVTAYPRE